MPSIPWIALFGGGTQVRDLDVDAVALPLRNTSSLVFVAARIPLTTINTIKQVGGDAVRSGPSRASTSAGRGAARDAGGNRPEPSGTGKRAPNEARGGATKGRQAGTSGAPPGRRTPEKERPGKWGSQYDVTSQPRSGGPGAARCQPSAPQCPGRPTPRPSHRVRPLRRSRGHTARDARACWSTSRRHCTGG